MSLQAVRAQALTFQLKSGEIAAELSGAEEAPLLVGIPGLSANLRSYDTIYAALDPARHRMVAYDPRGRGRSAKTAPGTYGWPNHAADVLEMADQLGARQFDLIGWSMGTWIAMELCRLAPGRVRRLVLIDGGGVPDESSIAPIYAGLARLDAVFPSRAECLALLSQLPHYAPWSEQWAELFDYELEDCDGGVRARTAKAAALEDEEYRLSRDPYQLWPAVTMPSLLVRAQRDILPGLGFIFTPSDRDRFLATVPNSACAEADANHYNIAFHADAVEAIRAFLEDG